LAASTYKVTLVVNGSVKASILNAKTQLGKATQLNFDLKATTSSSAAAAPKKKAKHMVWMPASNGTHVGSGWVEVDDNGPAASGGTTSADRVDQVDGSAIRALQSKAGNADPLKETTGPTRP